MGQTSAGCVTSRGCATGGYQGEVNVPFRSLAKLGMGRLLDELYISPPPFFSFFLLHFAKLSLFVAESMGPTAHEQCVTSCLPNIEDCASHPHMSIVGSPLSVQHIF